MQARAIRELSAETERLRAHLSRARSAVEAAQEVIGQCDCIMAEMSDKDPKRVWREARNAYLGALSAGSPQDADRPWHGDDIRSVEIRFMPDTPLKDLTVLIKSVAGCEAIATGLNAAGYPVPAAPQDADRGAQ
jgi:hypothetical protein